MYPEGFRKQVQEIITLISYFPEASPYPNEVWIDGIIPYLALLYRNEV